MGRRLQIEPGAYLMAAAGLLLLPLNFFAALAAAAAVHELCHYLAAKALGIEVYSLRIDAKGCVLDTQPMTRWQELLCAAAGPAGSLLLLAAARQFPLLAFCGAAQGCFNLLPLYPMDGGRILFCAAELAAGERAAVKISRWAEIAVSLLLVCMGFYLALQMEWGLLPVVLGIFGTVRIGKVKNSLQTGATQGTIELPFSKR